MDLRVTLKICEGCGCLWLRPQHQDGVYCRHCECRLRDFPSSESRKRRGRPARMTLPKVRAMAEEWGGVQ